MSIDSICFALLLKKLNDTKTIRSKIGLDRIGLLALKNRPFRANETVFFSSERVRLNVDFTSQQTTPACFVCNMWNLRERERERWKSSRTKRYKRSARNASNRWPTKKIKRELSRNVNTNRIISMNFEWPISCKLCSVQMLFRFPPYYDELPI